MLFTSKLLPIVRRGAGPRRARRLTRSALRWVLSVFFFLLGLTFASWAGRIPDIKEILQLNDAQLGTALLAAPLGQLPGMLLAGVLISRLGSRKILLAGFVIYALALLGLGLANSLAQLFIILFCFGLGANLFDIAINTQAVGIEKLYQRSIMSSFHACWSLGGVAGALVGTVLASLAISPATHFAAVLAIDLLGLAFLFRLTLPRDIFSNQPDDNAGRPLFRLDMMIILLGIIALCNMAVEGAMYDWSGVYYADVVKAPVELVRLGFIICISCMVLARMLIDRFITRFGNIRVLQVSGVLVFTGMLFLIINPAIISASIGAGLVGLGMAAGIPICYSLAGRSRTIAPAMAISLVTAISFCGFMLCPPLIGYLSHGFGLRMAFIPIALLGLTVCLLAPALRKHGGD